MGFVVRRSLPSIVGLLALVLAVGEAVVVFAHAPIWFPAAFAIALVGLQFAINPWIIQWLVPADVIPNDGVRYLTEHPVGEAVARRCRDAGIPLVTLGIVDEFQKRGLTIFGPTRLAAELALRNSGLPPPQRVRQLSIGGNYRRQILARLQGTDCQQILPGLQVVLPQRRRASQPVMPSVLPPRKISRFTAALDLPGRLTPICFSGVPVN